MNGVEVLSIFVSHSILFDVLPRINCKKEPRHIFHGYVHRNGIKGLASSKPRKCKSEKHANKLFLGILKQIVDRIEIRLGKTDLEKMVLENLFPNDG